MEIELFFIVVCYFMKRIDSEVVLPVILYLAPLYEPFKMWFLLKDIKNRQGKGRKYQS